MFMTASRRAAGMSPMVLTFLNTCDAGSVSFPAICCLTSATYRSRSSVTESLGGAAGVDVLLAAADWGGGVGDGDSVRDALLHAPTTIVATTIRMRCMAASLRVVRHGPPLDERGQTMMQRAAHQVNAVST